MSGELPFSGERFVPGIGGNIFLEHMHRYVLAQRLVAGKDVLDIASGEGFGSSILSEAARSVVGVDISDQAVVHAQSKYGTDSLRFQVGSATKIPLPDASVDVVVSFETIEHIAEHEEMLSEVKRVLRAGGVLVMSTPDKLTYTDATTHVNPFHVRELYRDEFFALIRTQFAHIRMHGQKIAFGSLVAAEDGDGQFNETDSRTLATSAGVSTPMYLIAVASDDASALVTLNGLFMQDIQASEPVKVRVEYELRTHLEQELQVHARTVLEDFNWMSSELATLQRSNWMSRASLWKVINRLIKVRLLYAMSRVKGISERRRGKFLRSAEKRDPLLLSSRLDKFCQDYFARIEQNALLAAHARRELVRYGIRVTAIVPNFNHARYLRERLDGILDQTYPLIDIIVLDDCSTDDSRDVINEYAARHPARIRTIFNDTNSGSVFHQWQRGYELAEGDLVWLCESDDFCDKHFVERLVSAFRDPSVMLAFGKIEFADTEGAVLPGMANYLEEAERGIWGKRLSRPAATWFAGAFGVKNVIANVGGSIWRRVPIPAEVWDAARSFRIMGDWYLYSALAQGGSIVFDPDAVAYFRIHGQNTSGAAAMATPEYYHEYRRLMTELKRRRPIPDTTVDRFVETCRGVYRGANITTPAFDTLVSAAELKAVKTEFPHVLIGFLGFTYGGGEIFPIHLANALRRSGVMVSMLQMMDTEDHSDVRAMLDPAIPVYTANVLRDMNGKAFMKAAGVDIVHSHIASIEALMFDEQGIDTPYVATLHGSYEAMEISKRRISAWAARIDRFVYTAERNLTAFKGITVAQNKFDKFRNAMPVDPKPYHRTRQSLRIEDNAVVFTLVARGIEGKGWAETVQAFKTLRARRPDVPVALIAVGEGPKVDEARQLSGGDPNIHFFGYNSAIHGIYRMSDVALVPTRFAGESFPLCLIQAMQVGVPCLTTDVGEIASMVRHDGKEAGLVLPYLKDDDAFIASLVDAMEQLLDADLRKRLARDADLLGQEYSIDGLAADYLDLYRDILANRAHKA